MNAPREMPNAEGEREHLSKTIMHLFMRSRMQLLLPQNCPKTDNNASHPREERRIVSRTVAAETIGTVTLPVRSNHRPFIVDGPVEQVEDIPAEDGSQRHGTEVLRQTADSERVRDERGEHAKEEPVGYARHARDENQRVRVGDGRAGKLGSCEHDGRYEQTPEPRDVQFLDQQVRADACCFPVSQ